MAFDPGRVIKPQPVPEDLICIICMGVLVDPVEGPCEHLACRACLSDWLSLSTGCPVCRQPLGESNIKQAHRIARNQLDALEVSCDNAARGCKAVVTLGSLKTHTSACGKAMERCHNTNCSATVLREDLPLHLQACPYRAVSCTFCDGRIQFQELQNHLRRDCPDVELACDHHGGCGQRVKRCAMATHIDKECSKTRVRCAILGCKEQVRNLEHPRFQCQVNPIAGLRLGAREWEDHCPKCYCWVCHKMAPCEYWVAKDNKGAGGRKIKPQNLSDHCRVNFRNDQQRKKWNALFYAYRQAHQEAAAEVGDILSDGI
eukprot:jgi/Mesvir1/23526/Mv18229-RA.2